MNFSIIPNTRMTNPGGIMEQCMYFNIETLVRGNWRLYFYKYNIYDLIEVEFKSGLVTIYTFPNSISGAERVIIDELDFYAGYFSSAGLEGKRFVFDCKNKMPVRYDDFQAVDHLNIDNREHAFILDMKDGYITTPKDIHVFLGIENAKDIDNCILSFINSWINIIKPKYQINRKNTNGVVMLTLLSGMLSGIKVFDFKEQLNGYNLEDKFFNRVTGVDFNSVNVDKNSVSLKTSKFMEIVGSCNPVIDAEIVEKEFSSERILLSYLIDIGLDRFIRSIKDPNKLVKVDIDEQQQTIKSMFIVKGAAFITPGAIKTLNHFRELLDSDNVQFVMN